MNFIRNDEINILSKKSVFIILLMFFGFISWTFSSMLTNGYSVATCITTVSIVYLPLIFVFFIAIDLLINNKLIKSLNKKRTIND